MNETDNFRRLVFRRTTTALWAVLLLLSFATWTSDAEDYPPLHLSLTGIDHDPEENVSVFSLQIIGGQVVGFPRVPVGWSIKIDNDPLVDQDRQ